MLKIAFIPTSVSGVVFYRMWQPYQALLDRSHAVQPIIWWYRTDQFDIHPWETQVYNDVEGPMIRRDLEAAVAWADVVIWMTFHFAPALSFFKYLKAKYDKPFLTEVDDYYFSVPKKNSAYDSYMPGSAPVQIAISQFSSSDGLIVSTPYLRDLYKPLNKSIAVVENNIDLSIWRKHAPLPGRRRVNLGWVGGLGHEDDLEMIKEPLFKILKNNRQVRFNCMSCVPQFFKDHPSINCIQGFRQIHQYPFWVHQQDFDIGLAPLVDNSFNRAKSNLRYLEYSAMGIPTIASRVGHFASTIRDEQNGMLALSPEDWESRMQRMIDDIDERHALGARAHKDVEKNFNVKNLATRYLNAIEELTDAKPDPSGLSLTNPRQNWGHKHNGIAALH